MFRITEACSHLGPECGIGIGRKASRSPETQAAGPVRGDILPREYDKCAHHSAGMTTCAAGVVAVIRCCTVKIGESVARWGPHHFYEFYTY